MNDAGFLYFLVNVGVKGRRVREDVEGRCVSEPCRQGVQAVYREVVQVGWWLVGSAMCTRAIKERRPDQTREKDVLTCFIAVPRLPRTSRSLQYVSLKTHKPFPESGRHRGLVKVLAP